ncbi:MAG: cell division protein FtsQ/DivIB, partial [Gammaproteobacteria bacterium]|nr:cell division protein FtsQ/DivIB [Gammaproteobacteria bacterium]
MASVPEVFEFGSAGAHATRAAPADGSRTDRQLVALAALLGFVILALAVLVGVRSVTAGTAPIREVSIAGEFQHLQPAELEGTIAAEVQKGFFGLDVGQLRRELRQHAWIDDLTVTRIWPDRLKIVVREQVPVAYWGDAALLNRFGEVFKPEGIDTAMEYVRLRGPEGTERQLLERYRQWSLKFAAAGLRIAAVALSDRRAWTLRTAGGVEVVLGRTDIEHRVARLLQAYPGQLEEAGQTVQRVDLRYTNGMAVTFDRRSA